MSFSQNIFVCLKICREHVGDHCNFNNIPIILNAARNACPHSAGDKFVQLSAGVFVAGDKDAPQPTPVPREEFTAADAQRLIAERRPKCEGCPECAGFNLHPHYPYPTDARVRCRLVVSCCGGSGAGEMSVVYGRCGAGKW